MGTRFFKDTECVDYYDDDDISHALAIVKRLKNRIDWYIKDRQFNNQREYYGVTLHYDAIIEELQKILEGENE